MKNEEALMVLISLITAFLTVMMLLEIFGIEAIVEQLAAIEKAVTQ